MNAAILLVEDDQFFARVVKRQLEKAGYDVMHCIDGKDGWEIFQDHTFDLCLLDIVMPHKDGFVLAQEIREKDPNIPIVFISSRYREHDRIHGFTACGCDDYLIKPFHLEELICRINVWLKRSRILGGNRKMSYKMGGLTFDYNELKILHDTSHTCIQLPPREAALLHFLCENANKKLKRQQVLLKVWGTDDFFAGRSMDVYLSRLRKHFTLDPAIRLETFHGKGFMLIINNDIVTLSS
jgi:two-component system response regulator VicR